MRRRLSVWMKAKYRVVNANSLPFMEFCAWFHRINLLLLVRFRAAIFQPGLSYLLPNRMRDAGSIVNRRLVAAVFVNYYIVVVR